MKILNIIEKEPIEISSEGKNFWKLEFEVTAPENISHSYEYSFDIFPTAEQALNYHRPLARESILSVINKKYNNQYQLGE